MESYKHQAAKDTLCRWINKSPGLLFRGIMCCFRHHQDVLPALTEFPVTNISSGRNKDGAITARAFAHGDGSIKDPQPSYAELRQEGSIVHAILDVGVINSRRQLRFGFEVAHRCPVSPEKAAYLNTLSAVTCEISAEWILCQVEEPDFLRVNRIFGHGFWDLWYTELDLKYQALGGVTPPTRYTEYE